MGIRQRRISRREQDAMFFLPFPSPSFSLYLVRTMVVSNDRESRYATYSNTIPTVWQVGSSANGAAEWQKLPLNDLSY